jgi:hypothetical protein
VEWKVIYNINSKRWEALLQLTKIKLFGLKAMMSKNYYLMKFSKKLKLKIKMNLIGILFQESGKLRPEMLKKY